MVSAMISLESGISEIYLPKRKKIFYKVRLPYKLRREYVFKGNFGDPHAAI